MHHGIQTRDLMRGRVGMFISMGIWEGIRRIAVPWVLVLEGVGRLLGLGRLGSRYGVIFPCCMGIWLFRLKGVGFWFDVCGWMLEEWFGGWVDE